MKRPLLYITLAAILVIFAGCFVDESENCFSDSGDITIVNYNHNPYNLYVDDSNYLQLNVSDTVKLYLKSRSYTFKMIQVSGYDSIPWIYEDRLPIDPCSSIMWAPSDMIH